MGEEKKKDICKARIKRRGNKTPIFINEDSLAQKARQEVKARLTMYTHIVVLKRCHNKQENYLLDKNGST